MIAIKTSNLTKAFGNNMAVSAGNRAPDFHYLEDPAAGIDGDPFILHPCGTPFRVYVSYREYAGDHPIRDIYQPPPIFSRYYKGDLFEGERAGNTLAADGRSAGFRNNLHNDQLDEV